MSLSKEELIKKISSKLGNPFGKDDELSFCCFNKKCNSYDNPDKKKLAVNIETGKWHCWKIK